MQLYVYVTMTKVIKSHCMTGFRASTGFVYLEFILAWFYSLVRTPCGEERGGYLFS